MARGRFIPGKGYVVGFTNNTVPSIGYTTARDVYLNEDGRPVIGYGYTESSSETVLIGSGYSFVEPKVVKYAIRTATGWASMSGPEQAEYEGYFDTLTAWEAIIPDDLVTLNEQWVAECYNDWPTGLVDNPILNNRGGDATRKVIIRSAQGSGTNGVNYHNGISKAGFWITSNTNWLKCLQIATEYYEISGIEVINTATVGSSDGITSNSTAVDGLIENCIASAYGFPFSVSAKYPSGHLIVKQCIGIQLGSIEPCFHIANYKYSKYYNCMAINGTVGFGDIPAPTTGLNSLLFNNCLVYNCTTDFSINTTIDSNTSHNATSNSTISATYGTLTDIVESDFTNYGGGDYSVASGSALIDAGIDLSLEFTTDIVGTERG